jgi:hypothetical protein
MKPHTAYRLAMLANGFWPLLNDCKVPIVKGWPLEIPDAAEVMSWDRSALTSTGLKIDDDLAVADVDVSDAATVEELARTIHREFPELFARGLVRHAGGVKEAWFARVDEPFRRFASHRWYRGSDPDDPAVAKHLVECFGSYGTRQFGVDGPHTKRQGKTVTTYHFTAGASPATVLRAAMPILPQVAYARACDLFDAIAKAAGLTMLKASKGERDGTLRCFELESDTVVETQDWGAMTIAELERFVQARSAGANTASSLRCSGTFHDPVRVRKNSHLINQGRFGIGIWDAMTNVTWHRRTRAPSARYEFLGQLRGRIRA